MTFKTFIEASESIFETIKNELSSKIMFLVGKLPGNRNEMHLQH